MPHRLVQEEVFRLHTNRADLDDGDLMHRLDRFNAYVKRPLPLSSIDLEEFDIDPEKVEQYKQMFAASGTYPPVVFDEVAGSMIDGLHRAVALGQLGLTQIDAYIGTEQHVDRWWQEEVDEDGERHERG